jgi:hypothetical protein
MSVFLYSHKYLINLRIFNKLGVNTTPLKAIPSLRFLVYYHWSYACEIMNGYIIIMPTNVAMKSGSQPASQIVRTLASHPCSGSVNLSVSQPGSKPISQSAVCASSSQISSQPANYSVSPSVRLHLIVLCEPSESVSRFEAESRWNYWVTSTIQGRCINWHC